VFRTAAVKAIACAALRAAQRSGGFSILAYVLMPDHLNIITFGEIHPSRILRFVQGVVSHRVIHYLKKNKFESSLEKIRAKRPSQMCQFSIWQGRPSLRYLYTEPYFQKRLSEMHHEPVHAKLAAKPEDYRWSSYRQWNGLTLANEPLLLCLKPLQWET
jgi:REP-associated tyrosine transposase